MQEFIDLVRKRGDKQIDAIKYTHKHFPSFKSKHLNVIQQVAAVLTFPVYTEIFVYKALLTINRKF